VPGVIGQGSSCLDSLDPNAFAFAFALGFWPSESRTLSDFCYGLRKGKTIKSLETYSEIICNVDSGVAKIN